MQTKRLLIETRKAEGKYPRDISAMQDADKFWVSDSRGKGVTPFPINDATCLYFVRSTDWDAYVVDVAQVLNGNGNGYPERLVVCEPETL